MTRYIARNCPKCSGRLGIVVNELPNDDGQHIIEGYCAECGYLIKDWRLVLGNKTAPETNRAQIRGRRHQDPRRRVSKHSNAS